MSSLNSNSRDMLLTMKDWKQAIRSPPSYKVAKSMVRKQTQLFTILTIVGIFVLVVFYNMTEDESVNKYYNSTYPLTKPVSIHNKVRYRIALVADLDHSSRSKVASNTWESFYYKGYFMWDPIMRVADITWDDGGPIKLKSTFSHSGRGMELSELVTFDGRILTFDDRAGIVYGIENDSVYAWLLLTDGNGRTNKGFKTEWATVKNDKLYIGGMGKEWTTPSGEFVNHNPMWIKCVNRFGEVSHIDWVDNYKVLRSSLGVTFPGYVLHESAVWSNVHNRWFFLPRRMSHMPYDEEKDETQGTNVLLSAAEDFSNIKVTYVGEAMATHGFSSFKFVPGTKDEVVVALKTVEYKGHTETYIMVFTIEGKIIFGETKIADVKYEGFEFI